MVTSARLSVEMEKVAIASLLASLRRLALVANSRGFLLAIRNRLGSVETGQRSDSGYANNRTPQKPSDGGD